MRLGRPVLIMLAVIAAVAVSEGSILLKRSLLNPRGIDDCFSCRAKDRPLGYPLISYFGKMKDVFVRAFNGIMASAKEYKVDWKPLGKLWEKYKSKLTASDSFTLKK